MRRSQSGAGWKTVMTIAIAVDSGGERQQVRIRSWSRIEDDEDGSVRMYGRNGQLLQPVSAGGVGS
jgi:hypothetical protein